MQETTNYKLNKIELKDSPADITVLNENWDTIDETMKKLDDEHVPVPVAKTSIDLNTISANGSYLINDTSSANLPIAEEGYLTVLNANENIVIQQYITHETKNVYVRASGSRGERWNTWAQTNSNIDLSDYAKKNEDNNFSADQTFTENISVTGTTTLTGNLTSNGTTITKAIDCNGNADVSGTLTVTGTTTLKGATNIQGATTLTGATKIVDDTFTFDGSNILITSKDNGTIFSKTSQTVKGTNPTTPQRFYTYLTDKDSSSSGANLLAGLMLGYETSGDSHAILYAGNTNASQSGTGQIKIAYDKSANKFFTYAPTPADSSNTTEIATTAWVRKIVPTIANLNYKINKYTTAKTVTLTNLKIGIPVYVHWYGRTSDGVRIKITSTNTLNNTNNLTSQWYADPNDDTGYGYVDSANVVVLIPSTTSITITINYNVEWATIFSN